MVFNPRDLADTDLENILLVGARAVSASKRSSGEASPAVAEPATRYVATPEQRRWCIQTLLGHANELARRIESRRLLGAPMDSPSVVKDYLRCHFRGYQSEAFVVVMLSGQHRVLAAEELFRGTLTQTSVYPREVVKRALAHNAGAVILSHNHPSGEPEPSRADEYLTQTLKAALALVDIRVLDHMVVGGDRVTSFAERGLL